MDAHKALLEEQQSLYTSACKECSEKIVSVLLDLDFSVEEQGNFLIKVAEEARKAWVNAVGDVQQQRKDLNDKLMDALSECSRIKDKLGDSVASEEMPVSCFKVHGCLKILHDLCDVNLCLPCRNATVLLQRHSRLRTMWSGRS